MELHCGDLWIRDANICDAEQLCTWWNDGRVMAHAGFPNGLGTTVDTVRNQLAENRTGNLRHNHRHMILFQNTPIGEMNYQPLDAKKCRIGIKICDFSKQNMGLGKKILSLFIRELFHECGFEKIVLDTNLNNKRAQHVYEELGFKKIRVNHNCWKDQLGVLQSSVDYELTEDAFVSFL